MNSALPKKLARIGGIFSQVSRELESDPCLIEVECRPARRPLINAVGVESRTPSHKSKSATHNTFRLNSRKNNIRFANTAHSMHKILSVPSWESSTPPSKLTKNTVQDLGPTLQRLFTCQRIRLVLEVTLIGKEICARAVLRFPRTHKVHDWREQRLPACTWEVLERWEITSYQYWEVHLKQNSGRTVERMRLPLYLYPGIPHDRWFRSPYTQRKMPCFTTHDFIICNRVESADVHGTRTNTSVLHYLNASGLKYLSYHLLLVLISQKLRTDWIWRPQDVWEKLCNNGL